MTHPTTPSGQQPTMAELLARVRPAETTGKPDADKATSTPPTSPKGSTPAASPAATKTTDSPSTSTTATTDSTDKAVPAKRFLIWAVPLVLLAVGAAVYHQSPRAAAFLLVVALVFLLIAAIAKWRGKRNAARAAANGTPKNTGAGPGKTPGTTRNPAGGKGRLRGALSAMNPFGKKGSSATPPAGGKAPTGPGGTPGGGKGGMFGAKPAAGGKSPTSPGKTPAKAPAGSPANSKTTGGPGSAGDSRLKNLLGKTPGSKTTPPGGKPPATGPKSAANTKTPGSKTPGLPGAGGGGGSLLPFGRPAAPASPAAKTPKNTKDAKTTTGDLDSAAGAPRRSRWFRSRDLPVDADGNLISRGKQSPRNWRNSADRYEERGTQTRRSYEQPQDRWGTPPAGDPWSARRDQSSDRTTTGTNSGTTRDQKPNTFNDSGDRRTAYSASGDTAGEGGAHNTSDSSGTGTSSSADGPEFVHGLSRNADGTYGKDRWEYNPDTGAFRTKVTQVNHHPNEDWRPLPAPSGLDPAPKTSSTSSNGGTMSHNEQQTGARSANAYEEGAHNARSGAAAKENIASQHRRAAAAASGYRHTSAAAAKHRRQASAASADAAGMRGLAAAWSQLASTHSGQDSGHDKASE